MQFSVNAVAFAKRLRLIDKIIPSKPAWPIAANVMLGTVEQELFLTATNMEASITTSVPANVHTQGHITTAAKSLLNVVQQVSEENVFFTRDKNHMRLAAGAFKMKLNTLAAEDFPRIAIAPASGVLLPGDSFRNMLKRVRYAISEHDKRYFIKGALLSVTDSVIALVATDGKRMSMTAIKRPQPGPNVEALIPEKTIDLLTASDLEDDWLFTSTDNTLFFTSDTVQITSHAVNGNFPNYRQVLPTDNQHVIDVPRAQTMAVLKRVGLAADDTNAVVLTVADNALACAARSIKGEASEHVAVSYAGPSIEFALEWQFVHEFLNNAVHDTVKLSLKTGQSNVLWQDGPEFLNVMMPMRV